MADEERIGEGAGKGDVDAPDRGADTTADVEQSEAQGFQAGALEFGTLHGLAKPLDEHANEGREQEAERVGVEQVAEAPPGEEDGLVVLDSVFRISPCSIVFFVELLGRMGGSQLGSHQEARSVLALRSCGSRSIGSHPAPTRPDRASPPPEGPEAPRRPARVRGPGPGASHRGSDPLSQAAVAGQADHVVDAGVLSQGQEGHPAEAGVSQQDYARVRPARADPCHQSLEILLHAGRRVLSRRALPGQPRRSAAEDPQRHVAVLPVVAVEQPLLLVPMQRDVRVVQTQDNLFRLRATLQEQIHQKLVHVREVRNFLRLETSLPAADNSRRLSVPMPASGEQSDRTASVFPKYA